MISGLLLLSKPQGMTSHQLVHRVRQKLKQKAVGHCGTLDPLAEGLMLIVLGKACKLSSYFSSGNKTYAFSLKFGLKTDTLDITGKTIEKKDNFQVRPSDIESSMKKYIGEIEIDVPAFSAVKFKGKKLYEYARSGKPVPRVSKKMFFYDLKIKSIDKDSSSVEVSCSKGSYIRSWVSQVGENLGCGAVLSQLSRLASEPYSLKQSMSLGDFEKKEFQKTAPFFIPFSSCLSHWASIEVRRQGAAQIGRGHFSSFLMESLMDQQKEVNLRQKSKCFRVMSEGELSALIELYPFEKPRILNVFSS